MDRNKLLISIIMPCLNEEQTVGWCVGCAQKALTRLGRPGEVIVCDNGSTDNSVSIAQKAGARVVIESIKGYGSAYLTGIRVARGGLIVIGDSDGTYDFLEASRLIKKLEQGYDLVIGSRLEGKITAGSMPFLNRYLGTPFLNFFLRLFYHLPISDSQSGMRAFTQKAFRKMKLMTLGMEFASEMLVRASQENLKIAEVPISYHRRVTPSKLSRFRDAWRHLRFMLLFAPTWLFLIPGTAFMVVGMIGILALVRGPIWFFGQKLDYNSLILASMLMLLGYQVMMLGIYAKAYSWTGGFIKESLIISTTLRHFRLEKGILLGLLMSLSGLAIGLVTFINWAKIGYHELWSIRPAILAMTLIVLGVQIIFSAFFLSILGLERKKR